MKKFSIILIALLIAAPLSSILMGLVDSLISLNDEPVSDNYAGTISTLVAITLYQIPIYLVVGIPVTLIIDFLTKLLGLKKNSKVYLFQFLLYSTSVMVPAYILGANNIWNYLLVGIPVHTYFLLLFWLRLRTIKIQF
ncbi:hypothetical protein [Peribacillus simplex]|uniref:hypothetical protein n=1 Tax=Peribacillus simplex TaxID=1478 RepID=UPI003D2B17CA